VIGKDILKFHAVFWPIMLKAMGAPLPKKILVHGWWQKNGEKLSKSTGNVVDPFAVIDEWGVDAFRYYVVRELDIGPDGNWTDTGFKERYDSGLANGLGNLVNRSLSMLKRYRNGEVPKASNELATEAEKVVAETRAQLENYELQAALLSIWALVTRANQYVDQTAPFKLAKDPAQAEGGTMTQHHEIANHGTIQPAGWYNHCNAGSYPDCVPNGVNSVRHLYNQTAPLVTWLYMLNSRTGPGLGQVLGISGTRGPARGFGVDRSGAKPHHRNASRPLRVAAIPRSPEPGFRRPWQPRPMPDLSTFTFIRPIRC